MKSGAETGLRYFVFGKMDLVGCFSFDWFLGRRDLGIAFCVCL